MTSSSTISVRDEPRYTVYTKEALARVDRLPERITVARFYLQGQIGWVHRESRQYDPDPVRLTYRLMQAEVI